MKLQSTVKLSSVGVGANSVMVIVIFIVVVLGLDGS